MATTTKSKTTRTTKKSTTTPKTKAKTAKKTTKAAKVTTKVATTKKIAPKKVEAKESSPAKKQVPTPLQRIRNTYFSLTLLYTVFAGLIAATVTTLAAGITLGIQARDEFASNLDSTVLGSANEVIANIEPKYVLVASLIIGALGSVLLATKLRGRYELALANRTSGFRWIVAGLSSAVLLTYVSLLAGITDYATLKLSGALILVTALLAFIAERDNVGAVKPKWFAYILSLFTGAMAWLAIAGTFIGTTLYGKERFEAYVYLIAGATLLGFIAIAVNQYRHLKAGAQADYLTVESRYLSIDMFTKFAVVLISLLALQ